MFTNVSVPTITRTIRIKQESDLILEREAERQGLSVNALVGNLVDRYIDSMRFFESSSMLTIGSDTIFALLDNLSDDMIADTAYNRGPIRIRDSLLQRGMVVSFESVVWFISQILGQYNGWFRCDISRVDSTVRLHLSHNYNYKWSVFLQNYVSSIFSEVLSLKPSSVISEKSVNIVVKKG